MKLIKNWINLKNQKSKLEKYIYNWKYLEKIN